MNIKQSTKSTRTQKYAKLNERISTILSRLYDGEVLSMKELAEEFDINLRTVQRDVNERLINFPIKKDGDKFMLNWVENNELDEDDIAVLEILQEISKKQGVEFQKKVNKFFKKLQSTQNPFYTKVDMEDISNKLTEITKLEKAIKNQNLLKMIYEVKTPYEIIIKPLKILNFEGFWYLLALDENKIKKYLLRKIKDIDILNKTFEIEPQIEKVLNNAINIWFDVESEPFEVELFISSKKAQYFKIKPISNSQIIKNVYPDGGMDISVWITHYKEINSIIKYWLPHIKIISPKWLDEEIKKDIKKYLD